MNTFKELLRGIFNTIFFPYNDLWRKRKDICSICPININGRCQKNLWLSADYIDNYLEHNKVYNTEMLQRISGKLISSKNKVITLSDEVYIRGCGCFIFFKVKSNSKCPLKFW